jgi:glycosyltransferase involved in cell wall biosynthesis
LEVGIVALSLVVATVGREAELARLLQSLSLQAAMNFEVIIVDQNSDDRVRRLIQPQFPFPINYLQSETGASRARNLGAAKARGVTLGFPDDDCWYATGVTEHVAGLVGAQAIELLAGRSWDPEAAREVYRFTSQPLEIEVGAIPSCVTAHAMFVSRSMFLCQHGFDARLGPGAGTVWGAMEEHDLAIRCLKAGARGRYDPTLIIYHPSGAQTITPSKARAYGGGQGFINAHYREIKPRLLHGLSRSVAGALRNCARLRPSAVAINLAAFSGRLNGYLKARRGTLGNAP